GRALSARHDRHRHGGHGAALREQRAHPGRVHFGLPAHHAGKRGRLLLPRLAVLIGLSKKGVAGIGRRGPMYAGGGRTTSVLPPPYWPGSHHEEKSWAGGQYLNMLLAPAFDAGGDGFTSGTAGWPRTRGRCGARPTWLRDPRAPRSYPIGGPGNRRPR